MIAVEIDRLVWEHSGRQVRLMSSATRELILNTIVLVEYWIATAIRDGRSRSISWAELSKVLRFGLSPSFGLRLRPAEGATPLEAASMIGNASEQVKEAWTEVRQALLAPKLTHLPARTTWPWGTDLRQGSGPSRIRLLLGMISLLYREHERDEAGFVRAMCLSLKELAQETNFTCQSLHTAGQGHSPPQSPLDKGCKVTPRDAWNDWDRSHRGEEEDSTWASCSLIELFVSMVNVGETAFEGGPAVMRRVWASIDPTQERPKLIMAFTLMSGPAFRELLGTPEDPRLCFQTQTVAKFREELFHGVLSLCNHKGVFLPPMLVAIRTGIPPEFMRIMMGWVRPGTMPFLARPRSPQS
jgi:hypothetical protein